MRTILMAAAGALLVSACSNGPAPAVERQRPDPLAAPQHERSGLRAPFVLTLEGKGGAAAGEAVVVVGRLALAAPAPAPIALAVEATDGFELLAGAAAEEIPAGTAGAIERRWEVRVDDPAVPFVVTARMEGEGFGASARKAVAFDGGAAQQVAPIRPGGILAPAD